MKKSVEKFGLSQKSIEEIYQFLTTLTDSEKSDFLIDAILHSRTKNIDSYMYFINSEYGLYESHSFFRDFIMLPSGLILPKAVGSAHRYLIEAYFQKIGKKITGIPQDREKEFLELGGFMVIGKEIITNQIGSTAESKQMFLQLVRLVLASFEHYNKKPTEISIHLPNYTYHFSVEKIKSLPFSFSLADRVVKG